MKLDTQQLLDLAAGNERLTLEKDDVSPTLISTIVPIVGIRRQVLNPGSGTVALSSVLRALEQSRTNQAAQAQTLATLTVGLWEVTGNLHCNFNYAMVPAAPNGAAIRLVINGTIFYMVRRYAAIGSFFDSFPTWTFLLTKGSIGSGASIDFVSDITGVGQTSDVTASVNVQKIM